MPDKILSNNKIILMTKTSKLPPELSIIIPPYNESQNIQILVDVLTSTLEGINWEVVFVDDNSPDMTSSIVKDIAISNHRVRGIQRLNRRGLSSAVIEGILSTSSPFICVMDADLQHDEKIIPEMLKKLKEDASLVIGSRYIENASTGTLPEHRVKISRAATILGNKILDHELSDPMSGFFMLRRELFEAVKLNLSGKGFKILLDIVASTDRTVKIMELPYHMKKREHGDSKLSFIVVWEFFTLLANKLVGKYIPLQFIMFITVGLSGVLVHLSVLYLSHKILSLDFILAQSISIIVAMTTNYMLNNHLTFNDRKHSGKKLATGLISFYITCSLGALINLAVSTTSFEHGMSWWIAGILGAAVGAVWNFAISSTFTWKSGKAET
jgi:dolichol-phosphate mannosyltransferase